MSVRFVPTPLAPAVELPTPRDGGFDPALADAILPSPARDTALVLLNQPGTSVVTTGQQPGLFTGPLYTLYKAVSTAALARVLERQWQRPVVPVFWAAGDDHDFAEASRASWISGSGAVGSTALPPRPPEAPLTPMYRQPLGPEVQPALEALAEDLPPSEFRDFTLDWLRRHYRPAATVADSFAGALAELLAPLGVVVLDSTHPAVKRAAARHLVRALGLAQDLDRDLAHRAEELRLAGADPDVTVGDGATLVMLEGSQGRDRLVLEDGGFLTRRGRERFDLAGLQRIAAAEPERLSPNVLLRPVVESALLPTVAYLAGPGELRYLALTTPIYDRMRIHRQLALPRWSGILVEPRVDRVLQKFNIELEDLLEPPGALEARLVRSQLPEDTTRTLGDLRAAIESGYDALGTRAVEIDPTLARPVQGAKHQALGGVNDIERKLVQHLKRRQETELGQIAKARTLVLPENKPQERILTVAPFLARHGPALLVELSDAIETWYASALEGALNPS
ncbi:MAG TPA: bacillithiol biosynthesis cysteine-adding enzyme BshC [Gemmatimonadales bacterium]|nr:bacillithiol biosynthesis cysteine-adding enzyme BshC [Gemmatimonadales bacterium]